MEENKETPPAENPQEQPKKDESEKESIPPEPPKPEEKAEEIEEKEKPEPQEPPAENPEVKKIEKKKVKVKKVVESPTQEEQPSGWGFGWFSNASKKVLSTVANTLTVVEDSEESSEEEVEEEEEQAKEKKDGEPLPVIGTEFFSGLFSSAKGFLDQVEKKSTVFIENVKEQTTQLIEQSGVMETMTGLFDQLFAESEEDFQHVDIKPIDLTRENRIEELVGQMKGFEKMGILVRLRDECEKVIDRIKNGEETFHNQQKILDERMKQQEKPKEEEVEGEKQEEEEQQPMKKEDVKIDETKVIIATYISELEKRIQESFNLRIFREKLKKEEYVHLMKTETGRNVKKLSRNGANTTEHSVKNFQLYATKEAKTTEELRRQGTGLIVKLRKIENWFSSIILCLGVAHVLDYSNQLCNRTEKQALFFPKSFTIMVVNKQQQQETENNTEDRKKKTVEEVCHIVLIFLKLLMHETQSIRTKFTDSIQKIYSVVQVKAGDEDKKVHALTMETCQSLIQTESFSLKEVEKLIPMFQSILLFVLLKFGE